MFIDTPGNDNQQGVLSGNATATIFTPSTGLIRIAPFATTLVAVLPSAFGPTPLDPTPLALPNFEVRGFVRITLPALFNFGGPGGVFSRFSTPQSAGPVRVLLTPQNRATFITAANAISGQTQASLPLASGLAVNQIPPEPGGPLVIGPIGLNQKLPIIASMLQDNPELASAEMLAALLGQIDPATANLKEFNAALSEAGIKIAIEARKDRPGR